MKRTFIRLAVAAFVSGFLGILSLGGANATATTIDITPREHVIFYSTIFEIQKDSSVNVTERISYDFGPNERHGIFRNIPVDYKTDLGNYSTDISNISVDDERGGTYNFTSSRVGSELRVKIGDADKLISGIHQYDIHYTLRGAIGYFQDFDELYWNAVGNEWTVPVDSPSATVRLPVALASDKLKTACYLGEAGTKPVNSSCQTIYKAGEEDPVQEIQFTGATVEPGQAFTIAVGFPKGIVTEPTATDKAWHFITDNLVVLFPIIVFVAMLLLWKKYGKDPKGRGVIVAQYDAPDGLSPLEISGLFGFDTKAVSAEIIQLAVKGFLKIERIEKAHFWSSVDYQLSATGKDESELADFDKEILRGLFDSNSGSVLVSDLENSFYKTVNEVRSKTYSSLVAKGYLERDPTKAVLPYIALFVIGMFFAFPVVFETGITPVKIISLILTVFIFVLFAINMSRPTVKGAETKELALGLKEYLQIAEKDRLAFNNAPEKNPQTFERLLPYAIALGVEKAWAKEFEGVYTTPPEWYHDNLTSFNTVAFTDSIHGFSSATVASSQAPGSSSGSGGGFAGGGGGGGGGGSW